MLKSPILLLIVLIGKSVQQDCIVLSFSAHAICSNSSLTDIPTQLPPDIRVLDLSYNKIPLIIYSAFSAASLRQLQFLDMSFCETDYIEEGAFKDLPKLKTLNISDNKIEKINPRAFDGASIEVLYIERNSLGVLEPMTFEGLNDTLESLYLNENQITTVHPGAFEGLYQLIDLHLESNMIMAFQPHTFRGLPNLAFLSASHNTIYLIYPEAFHDLVMLEELNLDSNIINNIKAQTFKSFINLQTLDLSENKLKTVESHVFEGLNSLTTLLLRHNKIKSINKDSFSNLQKNLNFLDLSYNPLRSISTEALRLPNLTYLDLSGCKVDSLSALMFDNFASYMYNDQVPSSAVKKLSLVLNDNKFECNCELQSLYESCQSTKVDLECIGDPTCDGPTHLKGYNWNVFKYQNCTMKSAANRFEIYTHLLTFIILMINVVPCV